MLSKSVANRNESIIAAENVDDAVKDSEDLFEKSDLQTSQFDIENTESLPTTLFNSDEISDEKMEGKLIKPFHNFVLDIS